MRQVSVMVSLTGFGVAQETGLRCVWKGVSRKLNGSGKTHPEDRQPCALKWGFSLLPGYWHNDYNCLTSCLRASPTRWTDYTLKP